MTHELKLRGMEKNIFMFDFMFSREYLPKYVSRIENVWIGHSIFRKIFTTVFSTNAEVESKPICFIFIGHEEQNKYS